MKPTETFLVYGKILYALTIYNVATRNSLMVYGNSPLVVYRALDKAERNGHIAIFKSQIKRADAVYKSDCITITRTGLQYLIDHYSTFYPMLSYLPNPVPPFSAKGKNFKAAIIDRFIKISAVSIFTSNMGIQTSPVFVTTAKELPEEAGTENKETVVCSEAEDDGSECVLLSQLVDEAQKKQSSSGLLPVESNLATFKTIYEVKEILAMEHGNVSLEDLLGAKQSGVIENASCAMMVFCVGTRIGFGWTKRQADMDLKLFQIYKTKCAASKNQRNQSQRFDAILLTRNALIFGEIYTDARGRRRKNEILGDGLTHFYVIPTNRDGQEQLRCILEGDLENRRESILEDAVLYSDQFVRSKGTVADSLCPLTDASGTLYSYGIDMDIVMMQRLDHARQRFPDKKFGIFCYEWQLEYYRKIWSMTEMKFIIVGMDDEEK